MRIARPGLLKDLRSDLARVPCADRIRGTLRRNILGRTVSIGLVFLSLGGRAADKFCCCAILKVGVGKWLLCLVTSTN
jgi:hypothetical protein